MCSCGERYRDFRTGLKFADVRQMMWSSDPDSKQWRQKRRHSVLGFWHELKLQFWWHVHGGCDE